MAKFTEIHPMQAGIIVQLAKLKKAKFSELNNFDVQNDWFSFHIRALKSKDLIFKNEDDLYELTTKGKTLSLSISTTDLGVANTQRVSIEIIIKKDGKFLFQKRLKEPFYGFYEFPTEKVNWGESPIEAVNRCLLTEVNIEAKCEFKGVSHKIELDEEKNILNDKYFFIYSGEITSGTFQSKFSEGENLWLTKSEILSLKKLHFDIKNSFLIYESDKPGITISKDIVQDY